MLIPLATSVTCTPDHYVVPSPEQIEANFQREAALVGEGICPLDNTRLEPRLHHTGRTLGWCSSCGSGWALRRAEEGEDWMVHTEWPYVVDHVVDGGPWRP